MLTLAAYRLESPTLSNGKLDALWETIGKIVDGWLVAKGVGNPAAQTGDFSSKTPGATGSFENLTITSASERVEEIS